jgi:uncharacterized membrane protein
MSLTPANVGRILTGVVLLFAAFALGGYLGGALFPESARVSKMEMLADKVGSSIGIMVASLLLARFLFRSIGVALICLAATEAVVFVIILQITGLSSFTLSDVRFNVGWLYSLTWNVVVAFVFGSLLGHLWYRRAANKALQATAAAPGS